jgi:hypothetical protein
VRAIIRDGDMLLGDQPVGRGTGGPDSWSLLGSRAGDPDQVHGLDFMALPLLYDRWSRMGHDVQALTVARGLRRRMIVNNRFLLNGADSALSRLREAGIDAVAFKGTGLIGRCVPPSGLRSFGDIDLWVRPSQHARAAAALRSIGRYDGLRTHAKVIHDGQGREIDLHILPSHLYVQRRSTADQAEAKFERAWQRRTDGGLSLPDLIYFTFLNKLFNERPGAVHPSFALIELDRVLRDLPREAAAQILEEVAAHAAEDRTVGVFVEHLDWVGPGASEQLDLFLYHALEPALSPQDRDVRADLQRQSPTPSEQVLREMWRQLAHIHGPSSQSPRLVARWAMERFTRGIRHDPWLWLAFPFRRRSWTLVRYVLSSMLRRPTGQERRGVAA